MHILVVEDNPGDFLLVKDFLDEELDDVVVDLATSLSEVKKIISKQGRYDVVLLDLKLPDGEGKKLAETVLSLVSPAPVIALTGFADKELGIEVLALGISDYLFKDGLTGIQVFKSILYSIERKKIHVALENSEKKYRNLFRFSPQPMWVYDPANLKFLDVNEAAIRHFGYDREEFLSMTIRDIRLEDDVEKMGRAVRSIVRNETTFFQGTFRHLKKNGGVILADVQSSTILFEGKNARLVVAIDQTEKINAERALQLSERRFKALVQDGGDLIAILDVDGTYRYVSPTSLPILGMPAEQFIGKNAFDFIHDDDKERVMKEFALLEKQKRVHIVPFRFRNANSEWRWIETIATNLKGDPAVGGIVANSRDVTEQIESRESLQQNIDRFDSVSKATSDTIWDWDIRSGAVFWNKGINGIFGYRKSEMMQNIGWKLSKIHPDDYWRVSERINFHIREKKLRWKDEYRFLAADSTYRYVMDRGFIVLDSAGEPSRMIGSIQDISHQKEEEHRLRLLESVVTNASDAVMITDAEPLHEPGPRIIYVNKAFTQMTGYSKEDVLGKSPRILQGPNTSRQELDKLKAKLQKGRACKAELLNYTSDGREYWVQIAVAPVKDKKGNLSHFIAIQRDVTETRNHVQAIEEQNTKLREIAWIQSHRVRAPLSRLMGLVHFLQAHSAEEAAAHRILDHLADSANELDKVIREIVEKAADIQGFTPARAR